MRAQPLRPQRRLNGAKIVVQATPELLQRARYGANGGDHDLRFGPKFDGVETNLTTRRTLLIADAPDSADIGGLEAADERKGEM